MTAVLIHWATRDFDAGILGIRVTLTEDMRRLWLIATPGIAAQIAGQDAST